MLKGKLYIGVGQYCQQLYLKMVFILLWDVFTLKYEMRFLQGLGFHRRMQHLVKIMLRIVLHSSLSKRNFASCSDNHY